MRFVRSLVVVATAVALSLGSVGVAPPASAAESAWGCGGWCLQAPTDTPVR